MYGKGGQGVFKAELQAAVLRFVATKMQCNEKLIRRKKNVAGSCALNFDAGDLPHSLFELSYPQVSKGRPEVDLVSTVCRPGPSKVRKPRFMYTKKGDSEVFFLQRINFPGQRANFCLQHVTHILKAINLTVHLVYLGTFYLHPVSDLSDFL